jgi:hypothetical protein
MILEQGGITEFDRYARLSVDDEKTNLSLCAQACHLVENSTSKFYSLTLCRATGREEFAMLKKMASVLIAPEPCSTSLYWKFNGNSIFFSRC